MTGCYPGCFYYTDSCFRKDCFMSPDYSEPNVYFNTNNELFYWIDPETNNVMVADSTLAGAEVSWRKPKHLFEDCDPSNPDAIMIRV